METIPIYTHVNFPRAGGPYGIQIHACVRACVSAHSKKRGEDRRRTHEERAAEGGGNGGSMPNVVCMFTKIATRPNSVTSLPRVCGRACMRV